MWKYLLLPPVTYYKMYERISIHKFIYQIADTSVVIHSKFWKITNAVFCSQTAIYAFPPPLTIPRCVPYRLTATKRHLGRFDVHRGHLVWLLPTSQRLIMLSYSINYEITQSRVFIYLTRTGWDYRRSNTLQAFPL